MLETDWESRVLRGVASVTVLALLGRRGNPAKNSAAYEVREKESAAAVARRRAEREEDLFIRE